VTPRSNATRARSALLAAALAGAALVAFLATRPRAGAPPPDDGREGWVRLVVLHTNDVHGGVLPRSPGIAGLDAREPVGGAAALASFVARERAAAKARGAEVLLLDGGDVWSGSPEGQATRGDLVVDALSRIGYDAVALGNHELDLGVGNAERLARRARFPWVSANVVEEATGRPPPWLAPWVVVERAGLRIAVVGLSPPDTPRLTMAGATEGLRFLPEVEAARAAAKALEGTADVLLFATHLGPDRDRRVADAVPAVALIVGGHTHARLSKPIAAGPEGRTWIVQAGTGAVLAGRVRLRVERATRRVALDDYELVPLVPSAVGRDADLERFLRARSRAVPGLAALDAEVGRLAGELSRTGAPGGSTPAGNAVADAIRASARADVAVTNRGGVRVTLPRGPVTGRDLHLLAPFPNTVVVGSLTGAQLRSLIEASASGVGTTPLEVSGVEAAYRIEGEPGRTRAVVVEARVGGVPLDPERLYVVATNSFVSAGGEGYGVWRDTRVEDTGVSIRDALAAWFRAAGEVVPDPTERLRRVGQ
jgi:2',3'-cyclic-nucleotide 2'-phosphodiesterase (5'-nucleotidase family)